MKTYLELVNAVLKRLRQSTVSAVPSSEYAQRIGELVNESKREVEDAWRWSFLFVEEQQGWNNSLGRLTLLNFNERFRIERVMDLTTKRIIRSVVQSEWDRRVDLGSSATGAPEFYRVIKPLYDSGDDEVNPVLQIHPIPDQSYTIKVRGRSPQNDLSLDSDRMDAPWYPVVLGAYALAVSERGEDAGSLFDETMRKYHSALNDAIALDNWNQAEGRESDWVVE